MSQETIQGSGTSLETQFLSKILKPADKDKIKMLVYGLPGTGKTYFSATSPNPLIIDIENGTLSLARHEETKDTSILQYKSLQQLELLIKELQAGRLSQFETIVIDSFSELQNRVLDSALSGSSNPYLPTGPDYNVNTNTLRSIASRIFDLDRNIIITAHVKEEHDQNTGRINVRPDLTPKLSNSLVRIFDIIGYMTMIRDKKDKELITRRITFSSTDNIIAKSRIGGTYIDNPSFIDLFSLSN